MASVEAGGPDVASRRLRMVVAEQVESAIASYEQPNRRTWSSLSNTIRH